MKNTHTFITENFRFTVYDDHTVLIHMMPKKRKQWVQEGVVHCESVVDALRKSIQFIGGYFADQYTVLDGCRQTAEKYNREDEVVEIKNAINKMKEREQRIILYLNKELAKQQEIWAKHSQAT